MRDELSLDDIALMTAKELWPGKDATEQNAGLIAAAIRGAIATARPARLAAALAASQADVTRLAAELAESVRALAVSQGEVERLRGEIGAIRLELKHHALLPRLQRGIMALLAPPAPTASPEPDRASHEVTVKETHERK